MKKHVETRTWYVCEICGNFLHTEDEARACEAKPVEKMKLNAPWREDGSDWEIGDFAAIHVHDSGWELVEIIGAKQDGHTLRPIVMNMEGRRRDIDTWMDEEIIRANIEKQLLVWADKVRARQRAARRAAIKKEDVESGVGG